MIMCPGGLEQQAEENPEERLVENLLFFPNS